MKPVTTLYMLMSVDGKISTGEGDHFDFDQDLPKVAGIKEGLQQYYDIEQTTDLWSLNSGRVQAKIGVNHKEIPSKSIVSFVLIDNHHLDEHGIQYFCALSKQFVLVTTNPNHCAFNMKEDNLHIIYQESLDLNKMLEILYHDFKCERITIQSGGTLNQLFLKEKLFDYLNIIIAPLLVGGKNTSTLIDGNCIQDLNDLGILELVKVIPLANSYIRVQYKVKKSG